MSNQYKHLTFGVGHSGQPFMSSSIAAPAAGDVVRVGFPYLSQEITVKNEIPTGSTSAPLRVGVTEAGVLGTGSTTNYLVLNNGESVTYAWRTDGLYLMGDVAPSSASVLANLTGIPVKVEHIQYWSGSVGC